MLCESSGTGGNIAALLTGSLSSAVYQQQRNLRQFFIGHYVQVSVLLCFWFTIVSGLSAAA